MELHPLTNQEKVDKILEQWLLLQKIIKEEITLNEISKKLNNKL